MIYFFFFFVKQKTAYEMRISDWSSDVCSSDLPEAATALRRRGHQHARSGAVPCLGARVDDRAHGRVPEDGRIQAAFGQSGVAAERDPIAVAERARGDLDHHICGPGIAQVHQIGRAHVWTPVTNAHLVRRLLLEKKHTRTTLIDAHAPTN